MTYLLTSQLQRKKLTVKDDKSKMFPFIEEICSKPGNKIINLPPAVFYFHINVLIFNFVFILIL